jgi:hepatitis B virus X-interacting protein
LTARGIAKASSAGFIASIAAHAKELTELKGDAVSKDDTPTISVEYGNKYVFPSSFVFTA